MVRASVNLNQDDILHTTYTNLFVGTSARQAHLKSSKFFVCRCERCNDPTELKTHFSSLQCTKCATGIVYTSNSNGKLVTRFNHNEQRSQFHLSYLKTTRTHGNAVIAISVRMEQRFNALY